MSINLFVHDDRLSELNRDLPTKTKLEKVHDAIQKTYPFIERVAVALYDEKNGMLRTFVYSEDYDDPIQYYEEALADSLTLQETAALCRPRVVNDISIFKQENSVEAQKLIYEDRRYRSSYTMPIIFHDTLWGFVFFNSPYLNSFTEEVLVGLDVYGHLISHIVFRDLNAIRVMLAFFDLLTNVIHEMDPETGDHIERVSRFSRLIATEMARSGQVELSDEAIEYIYHFAGLHDLGKIVIPEHILLKPGKLDSEEWQVMSTHAAQGGNIAEQVVNLVGYLSFSYSHYASNIPSFHHENIDGSGYPHGLVREDIPLEARIVAVADVFDALTSDRPYKKAWTNDEAFAELYRLTDSKLDKRCVNALGKNKKRIIDIQRQFSQ